MWTGITAEKFQSLQVKKKCVYIEKSKYYNNKCSKSIHVKTDNKTKSI